MTNSLENHRLTLLNDGKSYVKQDPPVFGRMAKPGAKVGQQKGQRKAVRPPRDMAPVKNNSVSPVTVIREPARQK